MDAESSSEPVYGWALGDPVTKSHQGIALEDEVLRSWADLAWPDINFLHRSAYDYIFRSPEADLPSWVRKIDIAQDLVGGAAWLFRYGLAIGIWQQQTDTYWRCVGHLAYIIGQTIQSHSCGATDSAYRTLDELCQVLQISLSEGSPLDVDFRQVSNISFDFSLSEFSRMDSDFWWALLNAGLHDYIISRFDILSSGRFAHPTCGTLLDAGWKKLRAPLMGIILDFLLAQANSKAGAVPQPPKEIQPYNFSFPYRDYYSLSWLSHGELAESKTVGELYYASDSYRSNMMEAAKDTEAGFTDVILPTLQ